MKTSIQNRSRESAIQPVTPSSEPQALPRVDSGRNPTVQSQLDSATRLGHHFARTQVTAQDLHSKGNGKALPDSVRTKMERAFGADFSTVRVHEGKQAPAIGALAYARGNQIHFAPGLYQPYSRAGQKIIGHEMAHVVQQRAGRVPVSRSQPLSINADPELEAEANALGTRAIHGQPLGVPSTGSQSPSGAAPVQALGPNAWWNPLSWDWRKLFTGNQGAGQEQGQGQHHGPTNATVQQPSGGEMSEDETSSGQLSDEDSPKAVSSASSTPAHAAGHQPVPALITPPNGAELQRLRATWDKDWRRIQRLRQQPILDESGASSSDEATDSDEESKAPSLTDAIASSDRMQKTHGGGKPHGNKGRSRPKQLQAKMDRERLIRAHAQMQEHEASRKERKEKEDEKK